MHYQHSQTQAQVFPFDLLKFLVTCGIILLVIIAAGVLAAVGVAVWFICTAPFAVLADYTLRFSLLLLLGFGLWQGVRMVRSYFFRARYGYATEA